MSELASLFWCQGNAGLWGLARLILGSGVILGSGYLAQVIAVLLLKTPLRIQPQRILVVRLNRLEWLATIQLCFIGLCALPILPNQSMGPWDTINPRTIGYLVVFIAGISYVGYFSMRWFGSRVGLLATSAIGGLVSSTAVTLAFAKLARKEPDNVAVLGAGISLAAAIMAIRVLIEVAVVNASLLPLLLPPLACLAIVPFGAAIAIALTATPQSSKPSRTQLESPLDLGSAIVFGLILAFLFVLVRATEEWFGSTGVYFLAVFSGITDVDALSLSLAEATQRSLLPQVGAIGIFIGVAVNTVVKGVMATVIGGIGLAKWCASILLGALVLGAIAMGLCACVLPT